MNFKIILLLICGLLFLFINSESQILYTSAAPYSVKVKQPDGSEIEIFAKGDEFRHYAVTEDGYTVLKSDDGYFQYAIKNKLGELSPSGFRVKKKEKRTSDEIKFLAGTSKYLKSSATNTAMYAGASESAIENLASFPSTGTKKVLMLLIRYPDLDTTYSSGTFDNMMNQDDFNGTGSFSQYYYEVSDGDLSLSVDVFGWYKAKNSYEYYGEDNGSTRARVLVQEAVDAAELAGVDFSEYDNDNDGNLDDLMVVHSGPGAEEGSQTEYIWSHSWTLGSSYYRVYDGVTINSYVINPETREYGMVGIGVFCHEFGHALGLPDLYDTDSYDGDSEGLGEWCLMGSGNWLNNECTPALMSAWARYDLGWINPTVISADGDYSLSPASSGTSCYKIKTQNSNEFFLLENRYQSGFDEYIPGSGLAIYHIDSDQSDNDDEDNKLSDLEEADGLEELDDEINRGDEGDVFPGSANNTTFTDASDPNAKTYDNEATGVYIRDIELSGSTVYFSLGEEVIPGIDLTYNSGSNSLAINSTEIDVDIQVKNEGTLDADAFTVAFYLSEDATITSSDSLIGTQSITALSAGGSTDINLVQDLIDINPDIPNGNYYVGYIIDYKGSVDELDETNNSFVFTSQFEFYVLPNLTFSSAQNSFDIDGYDVSIDLQVENDGNMAANSGKIGFYLSQDNPVTSTDYFLGEVQFGNIDEGGSVAKSFSVNVIDEILTLPAGNYYVGYVIDYENSIDELDETDNTYTYSAEVVDNYFIPNLTYTASQCSLETDGTDVTVSLQVKNTGDLDASAASVGVFISENNPVTSSDYFLGEVSINALGVGESEDKSFSANVNDELPSLSAGEYYVGFIVDYEDEISEDLENDNTFTFGSPTLELKSNLTYDADYNELEITATKINISLRIENNGDVKSGSSQVAYYLSSDLSITSSDFLLDYADVGDLNIGEISDESLSFDLTALENEIELGDYYIGYLIDNENDLDEVDEGDNEFVFADSPFLYCPPIVTSYYEVICEGDSVVFMDSVYKTDGVSEFVFQGQRSCDSLVIFDLTVNPVNNIVLNEFICEGDSVVINSIAYKKSGVYIENLTNVWGCDSTITLHLEVGEPSEVVLNESICQGDSFEIAGEFFYEEGSYSRLFTNKFGCDSTVYLNLMVNLPSDTLLKYTICEGDGVTVGNSVYKETGIYNEVLKNKFGCDSLVTLDLTVNPVQTVEIDEVICWGDSVKIGPFTYSESGTYLNNFTNLFACDSIVVLNLTVNPVNDTLLEVAICEGESIQFGDSLYSETGVYVDYLFNKYNCDSIVTLDLTVNPVSETVLEETICDGDSVVVGTSIYKETGSYTDMLTNKFGCDSTVHLQLMVNPTQEINLIKNICEGTAYNLAGTAYSNSGIYEHHFSNQFGCDSMVLLTLNVMPLPVISLGNDFEMFASETTVLDAGDGYKDYFWSTGDNTQTISISAANGLGANLYSVVVSDEYSCSSSDEIEITIYDDSSAEGDTEPLLKVFPNPSSGNIQLIIEEISGSYMLYVVGANGNVVFVNEYSSLGDKFLQQLDLSYLQPGAYSVHVVSSNKSLVERLIIIN